MKKLLVLLPVTLAFICAPVRAQQTNIYSVCTNYQENYIPGYYDRYGNYVSGTVTARSYNVQCGAGTYYRPNGGVVYQSPVAAPIEQPRRYYGRRCSPARTTLGGLLGGGIAAAASKKDAWSWAIPLGAVLGTGAANATCY